jgi:outer membrane receptor protein involved in Fe transport
LFAQLDQALGPATRLSIGLRIERRTTDYVDTAALTASPSETMTGGEITLSHEHSESLTSYVGVSKGYKAGGFNLGVVPAGRREFGQEDLWNVEAGIHSMWLDSTLSLNAAVFYSIRNDQQVRTSFQLVPGDPTTFVFFTDNAAKGETRGLEAEIQWLVGASWEFYANVGLLDAKFDSFSTPQVDLSGREQAHAPAYTLALGGSYRHSSGWFARVDASAKDAFFFDVSHDQRSTAYELVHARVGFEADDWTAQLWARNLFDRNYAVRGFYFGNEPPDFPARLYTRLGDPRQIGITFEKRFGS